jgi:EpsI family protein
MIARATLLAGCLLATAVFLGQAAKAEPIPIRHPLSELPLEIGGWRGRVEPELPPEILAILRVDDYTVRTYWSSRGEFAHLYVGYYGTQRQGASIHSPLNCLPGAGWIPMQSGRATIDVATDVNGTSHRVIEVNRVVIEKGLDRQLVLYWYQSHGRVVASEYWGKIYTVVDAMRMNRTDAALVRVIAPVASRDHKALEAADREAVAFVQTLFPRLDRHLPS